MKTLKSLIKRNIVLPKNKRGTHPLYYPRLGFKYPLMQLHIAKCIESPSNVLGAEHRTVADYTRTIIFTNNGLRQSDVEHLRFPKIVVGYRQPVDDNTLRGSISDNIWGDDLVLQQSEYLGNDKTPVFVKERIDELIKNAHNNKHRIEPMFDTRRNIIGYALCNPDHN